MHTPYAQGRRQSTNVLDVIKSQLACDGCLPRNARWPMHSLHHHRSFCPMARHQHYAGLQIKRRKVLDAASTITEDDMRKVLCGVRERKAGVPTSFYQKLARFRSGSADSESLNLEQVSMQQRAALARSTYLHLVCLLSTSCGHLHSLPALDNVLDIGTVGQSYHYSPQNQVWIMYAYQHQPCLCQSSVRSKLVTVLCLYFVDLHCRRHNAVLSSG